MQQREARRAGGLAAVVERRLAGRARPRTRDGWLDLVGETQLEMNRLAALQDVAIANAARVESVWQEDGTLGEVEHARGRVAIDAADLVAARIGASHHHAQRRVEAAVRLCGREPLPPEEPERPEPTGLLGLHLAMQEGRLDAYRAGVVAHELEGCPAEVAEAVVAAVDPYLADEPGPALRRRTRRVLVRISPDLLRQRVERSRRETGLQRWVGEPGVDVWHGTFPSEESAAAWSAIDRLARQHVLEGRCPTIERARARALTDLVLEHSDVRVQVVLTVPAETVPPEAEAEAGADAKAVAVRAGSGGRGATDGGPRPDGCSASDGAADADRSRSAEAPRRVTGDEDLVQVLGARPSEPVLVPAGWLRRHSAGAARVVCDPTTGARLDADDRLGSGAYRPGERLVDLVRARDGRCRFPGCRVAARFCDLDHVRPWPGGPTAASNLVCLCRRHHRIKQSAGWRLRLLPDGTAEWADPTGDVRRTEPLDALDGLVLHASRDVGGRLGGGTASTAVGRAALLPSTLEEHLDLLVQRHEAARRAVRTRAAPVARPSLATSAHDPPPF